MYTIFLSKEILLVSLVMIPDIVHYLGHGRSLWTNWRRNKFLGILSGGILVIFWVLGVFWSFFWVLEEFWSFFRFQGYFRHFLGFGSLLVIFRFRWYFGHFLGFGDILDI